MNSSPHENECGCDEDCDCEWSYVYNLIKSPKKIGLPYNGIYYQTYGGGPEGGYLIAEGKVYSVNRNWFETWTLEEAKGVLHFKTDGDATYVKFVQSPEVSLPSILKG